MTPWRQSLAILLHFFKLSKYKYNKKPSITFAVRFKCVAFFSRDIPSIRYFFFVRCESDNLDYYLFIAMIDTDRICKTTNWKRNAAMPLPISRTLRLIRFLSISAKQSWITQHEMEVHNLTKEKFLHVIVFCIPLRYRNCESVELC